MSCDQILETRTSTYLVTWSGIGVPMLVAITAAEALAYAAGIALGGLTPIVCLKGRRVTLTELKTLATPSPIELEGGCSLQAYHDRAFRRRRTLGARDLVLAWRRVPLTPPQEPPIRNDDALANAPALKSKTRQISASRPRRAAE